MKVHSKKEESKKKKKKKKYPRFDSKKKKKQNEKKKKKKKMKKEKMKNNKNKNKMKIPAKCVRSLQYIRSAPDFRVIGKVNRGEVVVLKGEVSKRGRKGRHHWSKVARCGDADVVVGWMKISTDEMFDCFCKVDKPEKKKKKELKGKKKQKWWFKWYPKLDPKNKHRREKK